MGQFYGHTHPDSFQILYSSELGAYAGVALEHPSLTTNYMLHPSYRVYYMNRDNYGLIDYEQYRMNVTAANEINKPIWTLSYSFKEYYGVKNMHDKTFALLAASIRVIIK